MKEQSPQEALAEELCDILKQCQHPLSQWGIIPSGFQDIAKLIITKHFPTLAEDKGEDEAFEKWWISDDGLSQLPGADGLLCKGVARNAFLAGITYVRQQTQLNKVRAQFRASSETGRQYGNQALNKEKGVDEPVPTEPGKVQPALPQAEKQPETFKTGDDLEECCNRIDKCFSTEDLSWTDINFIIRTLKTLQSSNAALKASHDSWKNACELNLGIIDKAEQINAELRKVVEECETALNEDALWCFDKQPPFSLRAEYKDGTGSLTSGPNNCRSFFLAKNKALAAIAKVKE